jgi:hypothetical protein
VSDLQRLAAERMAADREAGFGKAKPTPLVSVFTGDRQTLTDKGTEHLVSMTFKSSSGGRPHVVTQQPDGRVTCICDAMLSIESRPIGCWGMTEYRRIKGMQAP